MEIIVNGIEERFEFATESFYLQTTEIVAQRLIGSIFRIFNNEQNRNVLLRIVETEAYLSYGDKASHSFRGKTLRNSAMFDKGGILYVYKIYGIHHCINVVTEAEGFGSAVLIRAMEKIDSSEEYPQNAFRGPGKLAKSLGFTTQESGISLLGETYSLLLPTTSIPIRTTTRIGITKSVELPLRFCLEGSPYVSVDWKKNMV